MKNTFHTPKVGVGIRQSVIVKGGVIALALLALGLSVSGAAHHFAQQPAGHYLAEGDGTKVGAGG